MRFAQLVLMAAAGRDHAECVRGDLEEEFAAICEARGRAAGKRWYVSQVLRSIAPLAASRVQMDLLRLLCGVAIPLVVVDALWRFVYSQIPLKAAAVRGTVPYLACMISITLAGFFIVWRKAK